MELSDNSTHRPGAGSIDDAPTVQLDRAIVAAALESGNPIWFCSLRIGWLRIQIIDRPTHAVPPEDGA